MENKDAKIKEISELNTPKFTEWANEPTVADLKDDYENARADRDANISRIDTWLENLNVTGKARIKKVEGKSSIVPKLIRKQAEWRYAALSEPFLDNDDIFNVLPVTYEDKKAAIQNELILNHQFNTKISKNKFIDEYVRTAVDEGTLIARVGWAYEEEMVEEPVFEIHPTQDPKVIQELEHIQQSLQEDPNFLATLNPEVQEAFQLTMQDNIPREVVQTGVEEVAKVVKNHPTVEIVDYNNITIDPTAKGDINKANFAIFSFESSLAELEKDGKYTNLDKINAENANILSEPDHVLEDDTNFNFKDKGRKKFVVYEYWGFWDIEGNEVLEPIVASYVGNVMIRMERNPFPDKKLPFVCVQYLPVRHSMYGEPDGELLKDNQDITGALTRGMIDIMARSANGQMGRRKDALDIVNRRKFDRGEDYDFNPSVDPNQAFHMHTWPEIPQSAQIMLAMQNAEAESLTGVRAFAQSSTGNIGSETAAGVRSAMDAASKREIGILRRLGEGIKEIGRKFISMNAVFLEEEEVVRITNEKFVPIRRDDLAGNFDLRLTISTAEADSAKAEELAFMLQTTGQTMGPMFSQIILTEIARLRKMPDLAKKIESYSPEPDPMAEELRRLEIELIKAQIQNEMAKAAENMANANLDNAKASNLGSDTDQKNLDYVEQEAGVKQARSLELHQAQAQGNMMLEREKHLNSLKEKLLTAGRRNK